jgi:hypothetical protein
LTQSLAASNIDLIDWIYKLATTNIHPTLNDTRIFEPSLGVAERSDTDNGSALVNILKNSCTKLVCVKLKLIKDEMPYT